MSGVALEQAIMAACEAHYGQRDRAGEPYILHPLRVMAKMGTETERVAAVLHDAAEDGPNWDVERVWVEFGKDVGAAVDALTKRDGEDYNTYLGRVESNAVAVKVKIADLHDNSDMTRLARATAKDWERYEKYQAALRRLEFPSPPENTK